MRAWRDTNNEMRDTLRRSGVPLPRFYASTLQRGLWCWAAAVGWAVPTVFVISHHRDTEAAEAGHGAIRTTRHEIRSGVPPARFYASTLPRFHERSVSRLADTSGDASPSLRRRRKKYLTPSRSSILLTAE